MLCQFCHLILVRLTDVRMELLAPWERKKERHALLLVSQQEDDSADEKRDAEGWRRMEILYDQDFRVALMEELERDQATEQTGIVKAAFRSTASYTYVNGRRKVDRGWYELAVCRRPFVEIPEWYLKDWPVTCPRLKAFNKICDHYVLAPYRYTKD